MKIKNYIDCANLSDNGWKTEQLQDLKNVIIAHLPTKRILEVASVLVVRLAMIYLPEYWNLMIQTSKKRRKS